MPALFALEQCLTPTFKCRVPIRGIDDLHMIRGQVG